MNSSLNKSTIATGFCLDGPGEESEYPQVGGSSSSPEFQEVYWKCVAVFFASSIRHNPGSRHVLFTNAECVPDIGRFSTAKFLGALGVEIVRLPFRYVPPQGYYSRWRSTFYLFDILKHIAQTAEPGDRAIVCDSDCVFVKPAERLFDSIENYGLLTYDCQLPADEEINGLSRRALGRLYEELDNSACQEPPPHFGAEIVAASGAGLKRTVPEIDRCWERHIDRFVQGLSHFNTEEHFLSYVYTRLGYCPGTANAYIRRIWTGLRYHTAKESDFDLVLWHLPSEKKHGISRLFEEVRRQQSPFWRTPAGDEFAQYIAPFLGIPSVGAVKRWRDLAAGFRSRMHRLGRPRGAPMRPLEAASGSVVPKGVVKS